MIEGKRSRWCMRRFPDRDCPHITEVAEDLSLYACPTFWSGIKDDIRWYAGFLVR